MWKSLFSNTDLDLWPMTLGFTHDLGMVHIHHHTKFGDPRSNGSWDMNFFLVTFFLVFSRTDRQTDRRTDGQTDRQTDRRRRLRAHRAWAQVGSKTSIHVHFQKYSSNHKLWHKDLLLQAGFTHDHDIRLTYYCKITVKEKFHEKFEIMPCLPLYHHQLLDFQQNIRSSSCGSCPVCVSTPTVKKITPYEFS